MDIPIVHILYETYRLWHKVNLRFPKSQRYSLGVACGKTLLEILEFVISASVDNNKTLKNERLRRASIKLDLLRLLLRLAKDCGCMTNESYLEIQSKLFTVGKMLGGWIKYN